MQQYLGQVGVVGVGVLNSIRCCSVCHLKKVWVINVELGSTSRSRFCAPNGSLRESCVKHVSNVACFWCVFHGEPGH